MERSAQQVKAAIIAATIVLVGLSGTPCFATLWDGTATWSASGTLSTGESPPDLIATGTWAAGTSMYWTVEAIDLGGNGSVDYFKYSYALSSTFSPDWSHLILEVSDGLTADEIWGLNPHLIITEGDPSTYDHSDEIGIPGISSINGIKLEMDAPGLDMPATVSFYTTRVPEWGSFFSKGGTGTWAYNFNFGDVWDETTNPDGWGFLAVPDTYSVPVPAAVLLGILGLGVAGWKLRRFA